MFVCTANTARSHLAAALWRQASDVAAASAGTHPRDEINPRARAAAERHGIMLPNTKPRSLDLQRRSRDLIITVCDKELGDQGWAHWSIPDPVTQGTNRAVDTSLQQLSTHVHALAPQFDRAS